MSAFCRCTAGHWNALVERWNVGEWSRARCTAPGCDAPLHPAFTYAPPPVREASVGRLDVTVRTHFYQCPEGHWNLWPNRLIQGICGAPDCSRTPQVAAAQQTFGPGTEFHVPRDEAMEQALGLAGRQMLNTRERARLSEVSRALDIETRKRGYDPFGGTTVLTNLNNDAPGSQQLTNLAKHAFNHLYGVVKTNFRFGAQLRPGDAELQSWSQSNAFGNPQTRPPFIGGNCRAQASICGRQTNAVNFVTYGATERDRLISALDLANQPSLPLSRYAHTTHKHAEVRLAEAQDDNYERGATSVDKLCCLFCAAQMEALGRTADFAGAAAGTLKWYTFTPYVMYFRDRRSRVWGAQVERGFTRLSAANKIEFLRILATLANNHPFTASGNGPVFTGMPPLDQVLDSLP